MRYVGLVVGTILLLTAPGALAQETKKQVLMACEGDIKQFCGDVEPGKGRIKACMEAHIHELSPRCKQAIMFEAMGQR
jgi:hypothetical protein